jgi:hypothetical protein
VVRSGIMITFLRTVAAGFGLSTAAAESLSLPQLFALDERKNLIAIVCTAALKVRTIFACPRLDSDVSLKSLVDEVRWKIPSPSSNHLATPAMISISEEITGSPAPEFVTKANDGTTCQFSEFVFVKDGSSVLVFNKDPALVSRATEPFLRGVHAAGRGQVPSHRVIDEGVMVADE